MTDSFLYGSLLEEEPATSISGVDHTPKSTTANGLGQNKHTEGDCRSNTSQILGSDMVIVRPNTIQDKYPSSVSSDLTALLPPDLKDLPHSDVISLTSDPSLSLASCRVFRDEALLLVIFICNCTETVIKDVAVQLTCEELQVCNGSDVCVCICNDSVCDIMQNVNSSVLDGEFERECHRLSGRQEYVCVSLRSADG